MRDTPPLFPTRCRNTGTKCCFGAFGYPETTFSIQQYPCGVSSCVLLLCFHLHVIAVRCLQPARTPKSPTWPSSSPTCQSVDRTFIYTTNAQSHAYIGRPPRGQHTRKRNTDTCHEFAGEMQPPACSRAPPRLHRAPPRQHPRLPSVPRQHSPLIMMAIQSLRHFHGRLCSCPWERCAPS